MSGELVSCVMPTRNRRQFVRAAVDCWQRQTYQDTELIVVDDGDDPVEDLLPDDTRIRYIRERVPPRFSLGSKRNFCNSLARGRYVCHFDDDDWSAPGRIQYQLELLQETGKPCTGFGTLFFWDIGKQHARRYRTTSPGYVCGTTLFYLTSLWEAHKFPDKQVASDNGFIYPNVRQMAQSKETGLMVARIHSAHTSTKNGIREIVDKSLIPSGFWESEELRLNDRKPDNDL